MGGAGRAGKLRFRVVFAVVAFAVGGVGCGGDDDRTSSTELPAGNLCAPARTRHEHELGAARRASLDAITVVHMERPGADATDARDTATAGVDEIPYVVTSRTTRRFGVGSGPVARATLRDAAGAPVATMARGETSRPITLAPGDYTLVLVSDAAADGIVAVAPETCRAGTRATETAVGAMPGGAPGAAVAASAGEAVLGPGVPGVYVQDIGTVGTVTAADTTTVAFVGSTTEGPVGLRDVTSLADYTATFGAPSAASFVSLAVAQYFANGGTFAWIVATSTAGAAPTPTELTAGLAMLDSMQGYATIALPDMARLDPSDAATVATAALGHAAENGKFVVLDAPTTLAALSDVTSWVTGFERASQAIDPSYGALYLPALASTVPGTTTTVTTGASGVVTGVYAATDASVGPWEAPAGIVHGVVAPGATPVELLADPDSLLLAAAGVNTIRTFPEYGELVWGARTLAATAAGPLQFVPPRRTLLMIEESIRESLQWVVFEPNDQQLWTAVTRDLSSFLTTLWAAGALAGATSSEAFYVVCDASNNPPETRALGTLYVDIGLAFVTPAEFMTLRVTQQTAGPDSGA